MLIQTSFNFNDFIKISSTRKELIKKKTQEITTVAEVLNQLKICVDLHKL